MSKRTVANLGSFVASKKNAAPAPLEIEPVKMPASNDDVQRKPESKTAKTVAAKDEMVMLNVRVTSSFRKELKIYAAEIEKDMSEIVREGVDLYRQKHRQ